MDEPTDSFSKKVVSYLLPAVCGMIMGFIFFRGKMFQPHLTLFQFVIVSIEASVIFNILKDTNLKNSIAAVFVIFVVNSIFTKSFSDWGYILRDVLYILALFFSVYFFFRFFYRALKPYLYPLAFGLTLLFMHLIVALILMLIYLPPDYWKLINIQVTIAVLIGVGLGTGVFINDMIIPMLEVKENEEEEAEEDDGDTEEE